MRTIRRVYFYLVAFISVETLIWGVINLLRSITNQPVGTMQADVLSAGLAQVFVSVPLFLVHWLVVQRDAQRSDEEKNSVVRAIGLYGILLGALIPVVQNLLALVNRLLLTSANISVQQAIFGGNQTLADNLIAIAVNLLLAAYFARILRSDWKSSTDVDNLVDLRRLYSYIWMLYSLGLTITGVKMAVQYIFLNQQSIGSTGQERIFNAIALLLIGVPLWAYWWRKIQAGSEADRERRSSLRIVLLYLLALLGAVAFSISAAVVLHWLLRAVLGESFTFSQLMSEMSSSISFAVPFAVVWAYFGRILHKDIASEPDVFKQSNMLRMYRYILSALGLSGTIYGIAGITGFIVKTLAQHPMTFAEKHQTLAGDLAVLLVGVLIWLVYWLKVNQEAMADGEAGDHARRSLSRKIYIYLVIFASVIGAMVSTGILLYTILQTAFGIFDPDVLNSTLQNLRLILIFAAILAYHLVCLNRDNRALTRYLAEKQAAFPVVALMDPLSDMGKGIQLAFQRHATGIPLQFVLPADANSNSFSTAGAVI
ncbi:MAG: hypothetical protein HGA53_08420, partial [Anaerolineaceae bacterium]|nr:hypothetical protein [Anaerolineaceae bacterium]